MIAASATLISVIIPTYNRPKELGLCLEGFAIQTFSRDRFEVIIADDGSTSDIEPVARAFEGSLNLQYLRIAHAGAGAARNAAIPAATAPLLLLYDDDLRPLPDLVQYCFDFHAGQPAEEDAVLLNFGPDESIANAPILSWAFPKLYPFPKQAELGGYGHFWSGTLSCKRSIFRHGLFNPNYLMIEDAELGLRLARSIRLRVHYEPRLTGTLTRGFTFEQICGRQYAIGYFTYVFARENNFLANYVFPPYNAPEKYMVRDEKELAALVSTARALEGSAQCPPSKMLQALWNRAETHVRANGWLAAREGRSFEPPGTIGSWL